MNGKKEAQEKVRRFIKERLNQENIENLSEILKEAREMYFQLVSPYVKDVEQSWKPFKGSIIEDIILEVIEKSIKKLGLDIIKGSKLERSKNLPECLSRLKRSLCVDYGEFGMHLPDCDLVIYDKRDDCRPLAIISSKATLRERVAQTAYWSIKLKMDGVTKSIKVIFITLDEDGDLVYKSPAKKGRAIAEIDIDRTYVIGEENIQESEKVRRFERFPQEIQTFLQGRKNE